MLSFQVNLTSVTFLGDSYAYFETEALRGCSSLTYLEIPELTGAASVLDQPARLQLMCVGECTSLETVVFKGDADQYIVWATSDEQHPFYLDSAITTVVWCGTPWGGGTGGIVGQNQGSQPATEGSVDAASVDPTALFAYAEDVEAYFEVDFYASREDAAAGGEPVATVLLRSDVTPRQINEGTVADDQVLGGSAADLPQAGSVWALEGHAADEHLRQGCAAYDAQPGDIASCAAVLEKAAFIEGLEEVDPAYTLTAPDGTELVEGVDYEVSFAQCSGGAPQEVDRAAIQAAGTYRIVFTGIGAYTGSCQAAFSVVTVYLDCSLLGTACDEVAAAASAELYPDGCATAVLVNGGDARYVAAALALSRALDAPILLAGTDALGDATTVELRRLGATSVVVVGDQDVVSEDVRDELAALRTAPSVSRIAVADPVQAAVQLYRQFAADGVGADGTAYVVASDDGALAGAVAASAYGAAAPVFFAAADGTLDGATRNVLKTAGFARIVVAAADAGAADWVAEQVGNRSVEFEPAVGSWDGLLAADCAAALADGEALAVLVVRADDPDPALPVLAGWYAGASGAAVAPAADLSDDGDPALALLAEHAAGVDTVRFAFSDGTFPLDDINRIIAAWGASLDENGILTNGSEDQGTGSGTRASVYTVSAG